MKTMPTQSNEQSAIARAHSKSWFYATRPTPWRVFLRTFLPWQACRFIWINLKMFGIIYSSHRGNQPLKVRKFV